MSFSYVQQRGNSTSMPVSIGKTKMHERWPLYTDITLPQMVASVIRGPRLFAVFGPEIFHPKNRE